MSDNLSLELFSYAIFIELFKKQRYDAAMCVLPFMCLNKAKRSSFTTKKV